MPCNRCAASGLFVFSRLGPSLPAASFASSISQATTCHALAQHRYADRPSPPQPSTAIRSSQVRQLGRRAVRGEPEQARVAAKASSIPAGSTSTCDPAREDGSNTRPGGSRQKADPRDAVVVLPALHTAHFRSRSTGTRSFCPTRTPRARGPNASITPKGSWPRVKGGTQPRSFT